MKLKDLFEMPQDIEDLDYHDLNDLDKNKSAYRDYLGKRFQYKEKLFELNDTSFMYKHNSEYFVLDGDRKMITYYMKYKVDNNGTLGQFVWQSLVWAYADVQSEYLSGIPKKIFYDFLFPKFHTIITDSEQTWHGKRFWQYRISEAFKMGLNIYFFDFEGRKLLKLKRFEDLEVFQRKYDIWGPAKRNTMKRIVITDKKLIEK